MIVETTFFKWKLYYQSLIQQMFTTWQFVPTELKLNWPDWLSCHSFWVGCKWLCPKCCSSLFTSYDWGNKMFLRITTVSALSPICCSVKYFSKHVKYFCCWKRKTFKICLSTSRPIDRRSEFKTDPIQIQFWFILWPLFFLLFTVQIFFRSVYVQVVCLASLTI